MGSYIAYIHMKCFLIFSYGIIIYVLNPHGLYFNISMWHIKISIFFLNFSRSIRVTWDSAPWPGLITMILGVIVSSYLYMFYGVIDWLTSVARYNPSSVAVLVLN